MSCRRVVAQSEEAVTSYPRIKKKKGRRKKKWLLKAVGTAINTSRVRTDVLLYTVLDRNYRMSFVRKEVCLPIFVF